MHEKRVSWPSLVMLTIASVVVLIVADAKNDRLDVAAKLAAFWAAFPTFFLAQGYLASWAASLGVLFVGVTGSPGTGGDLGRIHEILLFAGWGLTLLHWSGLNETKFRFKFWLLLAAATVTLHTAIWAVADRASEAGWPGFERMRYLAIALPVAGGFLGVLARLFLPEKSWLSMLCALLVALAGPAAGLGIAQAWGTIDPAVMLPGDHWKAYPDQFGDWLTSGAGLASWCWTTPWVVLSLSGIAMLQRLWWGFTELRTKRAMPFSWLTVAFGLGTVALLAPLAGGEAGLTRLTLMTVGWMFSASMITEALASFGRGLQRTNPELQP